MQRDRLGRASDGFLVLEGGEMSSPTPNIIHEDGDYRISQQGRFDHVWMEHYCKHYGGTRRWKLLHTDIKLRGRACERCGSAPSEGLQAVFWFMKDNSDQNDLNDTYFPAFPGV